MLKTLSYLSIIVVLLMAGCGRPSPETATAKVKEAAKSVEPEAQIQFSEHTREVLKLGYAFRVAAYRDVENAVLSYTTKKGAAGFDTSGLKQAIPLWKAIVGSSLMIPLWVDSDKAQVAYYQVAYDVLLVTDWQLNENAWLIDSVTCTSGARFMETKVEAPLWTQDKADLLPVRFINAGRSVFQKLTECGEKRGVINSLSKQDFDQWIAGADYLSRIAAEALTMKKDGLANLQTLMAAYSSPSFAGLDKLLTANSPLTVEMVSKVPPVTRANASLAFAMFNKTRQTWHIILFDAIYLDQLAYFESADFKKWSFVGVFTYNATYLPRGDQVAPPSSK